MKRIALLFLLFTPSIYAQGNHRISDVLTRGAGVQANVVPYAKITVYTPGTITKAAIYKNVQLTQPLDNPLTADLNGNFDYYIAASCADELYAAPGSASRAMYNICFPSSTASGAAGLTTQVQVNIAGAFSGSNITTDASTKSNLTLAQGALASKITNNTPTAGFYNTGNNGIVTASAALPNNNVLVDSQYTGTDTVYGQNSRYYPNNWASLVSGSSVADQRGGKDSQIFKECKYLPSPFSEQAGFCEPQFTTFSVASTSQATNGGSASQGGRFSLALYDSPSIYASPASSNGLVTDPTSYSWLQNLHDTLRIYSRGGSITHGFGCNIFATGGGDTECHTAYVDWWPGATAQSDERAEPIYANLFVHADMTGGRPQTTYSAPDSMNINVDFGLDNQGAHRPIYVASQGFDAYITAAASNTTGATQLLTASASNFLVSTAWGITTLAAAPTGGNINAVVDNQPSLRNLTINLVNAEGTNSPGAFTAGGFVCIAGNYFETAKVISVQPPSGSTQVIQISGRYASYAGEEVYQGGLCGQGMVKLGGDTWTSVNALNAFIGYPILGSPSAITFKVFGSTQGGQNGPQFVFRKQDTNPPIPIVNVSRTSNVVTFTLQNPGHQAILTQPAGGTRLWTYTSSTGPLTTGSSSTPPSFATSSSGNNGQANIFTWTYAGADAGTSTGTFGISGLDGVHILPRSEVTYAPTSTVANRLLIYVELEPNNWSVTASDKVAIGSMYSGGGVVQRNVLNCAVPPDINGCDAYLANTTANSWTALFHGVGGIPNNQMLGFGGGSVPGEGVKLTNGFTTGFHMEQAPVSNFTKGCVICVDAPAQINSGNNSGYDVIRTLDYSAGLGFVVGFDPVTRVTRIQSSSSSITFNNDGTQPFQQSSGNISANSFYGLSNLTFTPGGSGVIGVSPSSFTCTSGHQCDSYSGDINFTTGTGSLTTGTVLTFGFANTLRATVPNCSVSIYGGTAYLSPIPTYPTNISVAVGVNVALTASTTYRINYICPGR